MAETGWYDRFKAWARQQAEGMPSVRESWERALAEARQPARVKPTEEQLRAQIAWALLDGNPDRDLAWAEENAIEVMRVLHSNAPLRIVK